MILVDGKVIKKPSTIINTNNKISLQNSTLNIIKYNSDTDKTDNTQNSSNKKISEQLFASRGAFKLLKGIDSLDIKIKGKVFLDIGASNGGFTQVLLANGATKVYAIDVGESQLESFLSNDERVIVMDKTNARNLTQQMFQMEKELYAVADLSFISLNLILPTICNICTAMYFLIKPQFECGKKFINNSGIVTNKSAHISAISKIKETANLLGFNMTALTIASTEPRKNIEYICIIKKGKDISNTQISNVVKLLNTENNK